jgi:hypothetical protein
MEIERINSRSHAVYPLAMSLERRIALAMGVVALAVVIGCGGSGGGGSTTDSGGSSAATTVEVRDSENYALGSSSLRQGETYSAILWGRDTAGAIVFASPTNWRTTASSAIASVAANGAITVNSGGSIPLSANSGASTRTYLAVSTGGVVRGRVRNTDGQGVPDAMIRFYDSAGAVKVTTNSGSNGSFRAVIPGTVRTFLVDVSGLSSKYYNQFGFGDKEYSTVCSDYRAPIPTRTGSEVVTLTSDAVVTRNLAGDPPPPPPNCGT